MNELKKLRAEDRALATGDDRCLSSGVPPCVRRMFLVVVLARDHQTLRELLTQTGRGHVRLDHFCRGKTLLRQTLRVLLNQMVRGHVRLGRNCRT